MFVYGWIWSGLKRLLVREGRASRQDFVLKGLLPLWLALFALLCGPAIPWMGELGLVLIISAVFFSRTALAMAVRRARDLGLPVDHFTSFQRQTVSYFQAFLVLVFATAFQAASNDNPFASAVVAAIGAWAIASVLLGGPKLVILLLKTPTPMTAEHVLATMKAEAPAIQQKPKPSHPLQAKVRPATHVQTAPESPPRPRPVYKTKTEPQPPRELGFPQPHPKPIVRKRKRGAIGEWT